MEEVKRTEQIYLKKENKLYELCHLSKNLYNEANYIVRQEFIFNGKWIRYQELDKLLKESSNYRSLPTQTAQQILRVLDRNWISFFNAMKEWSLRKEKFLGRPRLPKYKKKDGEFILIFTNQQCKIRNGVLKFPKKINLKVKTRLSDTTKLKEVRIIPKGLSYVLEIVYEKEVASLDLVTKNGLLQSEDNNVKLQCFALGLNRLQLSTTKSNTLEPKNLDNNRIAGIDLGVCNLVTIVNNVGLKPIVVKGGVAKSINQYYNKEKARLQSIYAKQGIKEAKKLKQLTEKRNRKFQDYFHKVSKFVVDYCISSNIGTIVIGYNKGWKQKVDLGKQNNQNFVQIPFSNLIDKIKYKANECGIRVILKDESYTSKCSFLDNEPIEQRESYGGRRISRGLFKSAKEIIINADVNSANNIIRKEFPGFTVHSLKKVELHPIKHLILTKEQKKNSRKPKVDEIEAEGCGHRDTIKSIT